MANDPVARILEFTVTVAILWSQLERQNHYHKQCCAELKK